MSSLCKSFSHSAPFTASLLLYHHCLLVLHSPHCTCVYSRVRPRRVPLLPAQLKYLPNRLIRLLVRSCSGILRLWVYHATNIFRLSPQTMPTVFVFVFVLVQLFLFSWAGSHLRYREHQPNIITNQVLTSKSYLHFYVIFGVSWLYFLSFEISYFRASCGVLTLLLAAEEGTAIITATHPHPNRTATTMTTSGMWTKEALHGGTLNQDTITAPTHRHGTIGELIKRAVVRRIATPAAALAGNSRRLQSGRHQKQQLQIWREDITGCIHQWKSDWRLGAAISIIYCHIRWYIIYIIIPSG